MADHATNPAIARYVRQGEFAVSGEPHTYLTAILGSCVGTCLYDEDARVGGMNHILLPHDLSGGSEELETVNLMELLINELMKHGADRRRLKGKLFGGARMMASSVEIGRINAEFATRFLEDEGIPCLAASLGGDCGRKVRFWPVGGRARQFLLCSGDADAAASPAPRQPVSASSGVGGEIELF